MHKTGLLDNLKKSITDSVRLEHLSNAALDTYSYGPHILVSFYGKIYVSQDSGGTFTETPGEIYPISYSIGKSFYVYPVPWNLFEDHAAVFDYKSGTYNRIYYDGRKETPYVFKSGGGFDIQNSKTILYSITENPGYLFISFPQENYLYDKKDDRLICLESSGKSNWFTNDLYPGLELNLNRVTRDGDLYGIISAADFREQTRASGNPELKTIAGCIKEDDNQIIVTARMK